MERAWKRQRNEKKRDINRGISGPWPRPTQSAPVLHLYLCQCFYHYKTLRPSLLLAHVAKKAFSPIFSPAKVGCSRTRLTVSCTVRNSLWVSSASWWRQSCETFFIVCTQQCDLDQIIHQSFIRRLLYASANPSGRVVRMHIPTLVHFNLWNYKSNRYNIWNFIDIKRKLLWGGGKKTLPPQQDKRAMNNSAYEKPPITHYVHILEIDQRKPIWHERKIFVGCPFPHSLLNRPRRV